jgi:serine/threonine-protein kinase RsbW
MTQGPPEAGDEAGQRADVAAEVRGDVCVVRCSGKGDDTLAGHLRDVLERCHAAGARDVVVDIEMRHALDEASIDVLLTCAAEFRHAGGELVVACEEPKLKSSLREVGLGPPGAEGGPQLEGIDLMQLPAKPRWQHVFSFPAARYELPNARRHVVALAEICGLEGATLFEFTVAVGEALTNAVVHGSPRGEQDDVEVHFYCYERVVAVEVADHGRGLDSTPIRAPAVTASAGRGIHFMRALTDDLLLNADERGTRVLLLKRRPVDKAA